MPTTRRRRGELLIAIGRLALAAFSLLALQLGSASAERLARPLELALVAYLGYALAVAAIAWWLWRLPTWLGVATHAVDLACASLLSALSLGPASPYFAFLVFAMVSATIRWQRRGTLWTLAAAIVAFAGLAWYSSLWLERSELAFDHLLVRSIYLVVMALLLAYLGSHQQDLIAELARMSEWPRVASEDRRRVLEAALGRVAEILRAPRVTLLWEEDEEPRTHIASWERGSLIWERRAPRELIARPEPLLADGRDRLFFTRPDGVVAVCERGQRQRLARAAIDSGIHGAELFAGRPWSSAICVALQGQSARGYLVAFDKAKPSPDDLATVQLMARIIASQLDQLELIRSQRRIAGDQERIQLARDLHDGVNQSLAGAALQLQSAVRTLASDPAAGRTRVARVLDLLENEQRDLRRYLHRGRSEESTELDDTGCLRRTVERAISTWSLDIRSHGEAAFGPAHPAAWRRQLCWLVNEALSNAARHSGATHADLSLAIDAAGARISLRDDGRGFAFVGIRDLAALEADDIGPHSIRQRVRALAGTLSIASSRAGATLEIYLPIPTQEP